MVQKKFVKMKMIDGESPELMSEVRAECKGTTKVIQIATYSQYVSVRASLKAHIKP